MAAAGLEGRISAVAGQLLAQHGYVAPVEVLVGLGWLPSSREEGWRQGRLPALEEGVQAGPAKLADVMELLSRWARGQHLEPSEAAYVARTRDRRMLRFSISGDPHAEEAYRTHWVSPSLTDAQRRRLAERQSRAPDLVVVSALKDWTCAECSGTGDLLIMEDAGPICMTCADLDHLVFLASGDAALSRRAKKASKLCAVVVRFSRARRRYERQGILVEEDALARAEAECSRPTMPP
jgi:hypothetical protein